MSDQRAFRSPTLIERFHKFAVKSEGCWDWSGTKTEWGYGVLSDMGQKLMAHRVSYTLFVGEVPKGMFVCHRCDNPPCTNPDHLFLGRPKDNTHDMIRKGRQSRKSINRLSSNGSAKLTEQQVIEIRGHLARHSNVVLGKQFGVSASTISAIRHNKSWKDA